MQMGKAQKSSLKNKLVEENFRIPPGEREKT
jgi:hypothetical protein